MLLLPQLEIINADFDRSGPTYLYNVGNERKSFQKASTSKLNEQQEYEDEKQEQVKEQHDLDSDESIEINIDDSEHMKVLNKMNSAFKFYALFFGMETK